MAKKPKYRAEKIANKWYAMRGEEIASEAYRTKREAIRASILREAADLRYEEKEWSIANGLS
jgi:hypothetical protein